MLSEDGGATMRTASEKLRQPQPRPHRATAAAILDLLLGLFVGALAVTNMAEAPRAYTDWLAVLSNVSMGLAAGLFGVAGVTLLVRRIAVGARIGQAAVGVSVVLIDGALIHAAVTCEGLACAFAGLTYLSVVIVTVVGVSAWLLNRSAIGSWQ
jgi:hypothetical protein